MIRLQASRQYDIEDWFVPALRDLIGRDEPLTTEEINKLGLDFAVKVIELREKARGPMVLRQVFHVVAHTYGSSGRAKETSMTATPPWLHTAWSTTT